MTQRVVITGGAGLVGRFITEHFLSAGDDVVVTGRTAPPRDHFSKQVAFAPMPLDPSHDYTPLFEGADIIVHGAFAHIPGRYRGGEGDDPASFRRQNLDASIKLFKDAKSAGAKHLVFLSSRAAYGPALPGEVLTEDMAGEPSSLYGQVKRDSERALADLASDNFTPVSLRITGVYGPAAPGVDHKWVPLFEDYADGLPITPRAATEVHGNDVANAVACVTKAPRRSVAGQTFNVSDLIVDVRDILAPLADRLNGACPLPAAGDAEALCAMATSRLEALGWQPGGRELFDQTITSLAEEFIAR